MIYTVTLNPSLDYLVKVDGFQLGKTNRNIEETMTIGGKGINVSTVLTNLGMKTKALGIIAGFTGEEIQKRLAQCPFESEFVKEEAGYSRINVKIKNEDGTEINGRGPDYSEETVHLFYRLLEQIQDGDTLVLSGSVPDCLTSHAYKNILTKLKDRQLQIVVDTSKDLLKEVLPLHPFLIKPNLQELMELFQTNIRQDQVLQYARKLQQRGARNVLVSLSGQGAYLLCEDQHSYKADALSGEVVDTVGAGDSMIAGFLYGLPSYTKAFAYGIATASATCFSTGLAKGETIRELVGKVQVKQIS